MPKWCLPAELLSRAKLWIHEVGWLKQDIASWSITKSIQKCSDKEEFETKIVKSLVLTNPVAVPYISQSAIENMIYASRYSSLEILRVPAVCFRFAKEAERR